MSEDCDINDSASLLQTVVVEKPADTASALAQSESVFPLNHSVIPPILLMTGKYESIEDFPSELRANLLHTLKLTPGLRLDYMNDKSCREFLEQHADPLLVQHFDREVHGSFKGDICRTAVLLERGGFYMDLDFQLHVPLHSLIESNTTLMTVYDSSQSVLNALMAVKPNSTAMRYTLKEFLKWYSSAPDGLLGPHATMRGILDMMQLNCPNVSMARTSSAQWQCGKSENIRFYQEETIGMGDCKLAGPIVCPPERMDSRFGGIKFATFKIGTESQETRLIGWPRIASCATMGCGFNGGSPSLLEKGGHRKYRKSER